LSEDDETRHGLRLFLAQKYAPFGSHVTVLAMSCSHASRVSHLNVHSPSLETRDWGIHNRSVILVLSAAVQQEEGSHFGVFESVGKSREMSNVRGKAARMEGNRLSVEAQRRLSEFTSYLVGEGLSPPGSGPGGVFPSRACGRR
jgi:hypothetical protein